MYPRLSLWGVLKRSVALISLAGLHLVIILMAVLMIIDIVQFGELRPGTRILGVDVGGLCKEDALAKINEERDLSVFNNDINLIYEGAKWNIPLYRIGGYLDLKGMVDEAYEKGWSEKWYNRLFARVSFSRFNTDLGAVMKYDEGMLENTINEIKSNIDRDPVNAEIKLVSRQLYIANSSEGWTVEAEDLRNRIIEALTGENRDVLFDITVVPPAISDDQIGKVIVVDTSRKTLTLYSNMKVEKVYPVATGKASHPTPRGTYRIVSKQRHPTWVNPGSEWAKDMPPYIPPGPGNPLGTRALATSASGVLIHGTSSSWSIGSAASHGCIRMHIRDSEDLFERVEVGIPVLIWSS